MLVFEERIKTENPAEKDLSEQGRELTNNKLNPHMIADFGTGGRRVLLPCVIPASPKIIPSYFPTVYGYCNRPSLGTTQQNVATVFTA